MNVESFEDRYRQLELELGAFNVGEAIRVLAGLPPGDSGWDNVLTAEIRRCVQLHGQHYAAHEAKAPVTVTVGRRPLTISHSHDEMIATIGFLQGATFVVAALQEQGLVKA